MDRWVLLLGDAIIVGFFGWSTFEFRRFGGLLCTLTERMVRVEERYGEKIEQLEKKTDLIQAKINVA